MGHFQMDKFKFLDFILAFCLTKIENKKKKYVLSIINNYLRNTFEILASININKKLAIFTSKLSYF